ncbi:MAG: VPLPA-CTERM sorting domain-containing protein [Gammaproteobacteria bacterium]
MNASSFNLLHDQGTSHVSRARLEQGNNSRGAACTAGSRNARAMKPSSYGQAALATLVLGVFAIASTTLHADQIAPNPNAGTITINDGDFNESIFFLNLASGEIVSDGRRFFNRGLLTNEGVIAFENLATFTNDGVNANLNNSGLVQISTASILFNQDGAYLLNSNSLISTGSFGGIVNQDSGTALVNYGSGYLLNEDGAWMQNRDGATLDNGGGAELRNFSRITNGGVGTTLRNFEGADLYNDGGDLTNGNGAFMSNTGAGTTLTNWKGGSLNNLTGGELRNRQEAILTNTGNGTVLTNEDATLRNSAGGAQIINADQAWLINRGNNALFENFAATLRNTSNAIIFNENGAQLVNRNANIYNESGATLLNRGPGTLLNNDAGGLVENDNATIRNQQGATLQNTARLFNINGAELRNETQGEFVNTGATSFIVNRSASLINTGIGTQLKNQNNAQLTNDFPTGVLRNEDGATLINESGALLSSLNGSSLINTGRATGPGGTVLGFTQLINRGGGVLQNHNSTLINDDLAILTNTGAGTRLENVQGGTLINQRGASGLGGRLFNEDGAVLLNDASSTLINQFELANHASIDNDGRIENSADFYISDTGTVTGSGTYQQLGGETRVVGSMEQGIVRIEAGVLSGIGNIMSTIEALYVGPGAIIEPGGSLGTLSIGGDLVCDGCLLNIEIGTAGVDLLDITGTASFLGGDINFSFIDGFMPEENDMFTFLGAGAINGLDNMSLSYTGAPPGLDFELSSDGILLAISTSPVPVPAAVWLFGSGLIGLIGVARRKNA